MKNLLANIFMVIILITGVSTAKVMAQAPEGFSYQAVIRDVNGELISDQTIGIQK